MQRAFSAAFTSWRNERKYRVLCLITGICWRIYWVPPTTLRALRKRPKAIRPLNPIVNLLHPFLRQPPRRIIRTSRTPNPKNHSVYRLLSNHHAKSRCCKAHGMLWLVSLGLHPSNRGKKPNYNNPHRKRLLFPVRRSLRKHPSQQSPSLSPPVIRKRSVRRQRACGMLLQMIPRPNKKINKLQKTPHRAV